MNDEYNLQPLQVWFVIGNDWPRRNTEKGQVYCDKNDKIHKIDRKIIVHCLA